MFYSSLTIVIVSSVGSPGSYSP